MNKIYYLATCDTCRKIIKSLPKDNNLVFHDIKQNPITEAELEEMSGLADQFVSNGQLDIYRETYERLKSKFDRVESSFDMYGDNHVSISANKSTEGKLNLRLVSLVL